MASFTTEAIILKRTNYGEADKILTVFTKSHGKLHLLAKGVRKTTSRKAPHLEPFSLTKLFVAKGKNLNLITEAEIINNFSHLRKNLKKVGLAYEICELTERLTPEEQINRSLFALLLSELEELDNSKIPDSYDLNDFILKLLWDLGYLPREKTIPESNIASFVEEVMEHKLKSKQLLTKIDGLI